MSLPRTARGRWCKPGEPSQTIGAALVPALVPALVLAFALTLLACSGAERRPASASPSANAQLAQLPAAYRTANYANGRRMFQRCAACHSLGHTTAHRVGPNLGGVFTRQAGTAAGYPLYSQALRDAQFTWSPEHIDAWLADPEYYLPGNNMRFLGIDDAEDRRDLIAYLLTETLPPASRDHPENTPPSP